VTLSLYIHYLSSSGAIKLSDKNPHKSKIKRLCKKMEKKIRKRQYKKALSVSSEMAAILFPFPKKPNIKRKRQTVRSVRKIFSSDDQGSTDVGKEVMQDAEEVYAKHIKKKTKSGLKIS
jgi:hypothetical protein